MRFAYVSFIPMLRLISGDALRVHRDARSLIGCPLDRDSILKGYRPGSTKITLDSVAKDLLSARLGEDLRRLGAHEGLRRGGALRLAAEAQVKASLVALHRQTRAGITPRDLFRTGVGLTVAAGQRCGIRS
jgi:hypothetical protein